MAVFRVEHNANYTTMSNYHLQDQSLSLKAKGLLSIFLSLPDEWHYSISGITKITKEGRGAISTTVRELEKAGYLIRKQKRRRDGKVDEIEYVIFERPQEKQENSGGVQIVRYGDGATSRDAVRPPEQQDTEQEAYEDFEWDPEEGQTAGCEPAEIPIAGSSVIDNPVVENQVMGNPATGEPVAEDPVAGNPAAEKRAAKNPTAENRVKEKPAKEDPAGLITNTSITKKSNTKGIKDEGIKGGQQFRRYGTFGNVFLTDDEFDRLKREFPSDYMRRIERLSEYMATTGKRYDNHLSTMERWSRWDSDKPPQSQPPGRSYSHERYRDREGESL